MPVFLQNKFYGGLSEDKFMGIPNSFQDGESIDIKANVMGFQLANEANATTQNDTITTEGKVLINASKSDFATYRKILFAGNAVWVYDGAWDKVYTIVASSQPVRSAIQYNGYVYFTQDTALHRIPEDDIIDNPWTTVSETYQSLTQPILVTKIPMFVYNNVLYITDGNSLASLDSAGTYTTSALNLDDNEAVVAMTDGGEYLRIYTVTPYGSKIRLWDTKSSEAAYIKDIEGNKIREVAQLGETDYILMGQGVLNLYMSQGTDIQKVRTLDQTFLTSKMAVFNDNIVFTDNNTIKSYGRRNTSLPLSLNNEHKTQNASDDEITDITIDENNTLWVAWNNKDTTYGVDQILNKASSDFDDGFLIINPIQGENSINLKKDLTRIRIAFDKLNAGEKIQVYTRKDGATTFNLVLTVDADVAEDLTLVDKESNNPFVDTDFFYLEIKIVLTAGTSNDTTPVLRELFVEYDLTQS